MGTFPPERERPARVVRYAGLRGAFAAARTRRRHRHRAAAWAGLIDSSAKFPDHLSNAWRRVSVTDNTRVKLETRRQLERPSHRCVDPVGFIAESPSAQQGQENDVRRA